MSFQRAPTHLLNRISLLLIVLMIGFLPFIPNAFAQEYVEEDPFVITGSFAGTFELNSSETSLFHLEGVAPGDTWTGTIIYKNTCKDKMTVSLLEVKNDLEDSTLFDTLTLSIKNGEEVVYNGTYGFNTPVVSDYLLEPGQELELDVVVELPINVTNVIQNKEMDSTWIFEAKYYGNPAPPTGVDLFLDNIMDASILWIVLLALIGVTIVSVRIAKVRKTAKKEGRSERNEK